MAGLRCRESNKKPRFAPGRNILRHSSYHNAAHCLVEGNNFLLNLLLSFHHLTLPVLKFGDSRFIGRPMSFPSASFFSVRPTDVLGKSIPGKAAHCETGSSSIERDSACVADVLILAQSKPS